MILFRLNGARTLVIPTIKFILQCDFVITYLQFTNQSLQISIVLYELAEEIN